MDIEIRVPEESELDRWAFAETSAFGGHPEPGWKERERPLMPQDRMLGAFDGDTVVGTCNSYPFAMTVPGGASVAAGGVSAVAVLGTHRRRGILTEMMRVQLDDLAARGEPVAILNASEPAIYPRFGYGLASSLQTVRINTLRSGFVRRPDAGGRIVAIPQEEAHGPLAAVWDRCLPHTPGELTRTEAWWAMVLGETEIWKGGGKYLVALHEDASGQPDGSVLYRITRDGFPGTWQLDVREMVATDPLVRAALWRHVLDADLIGTVEYFACPMDDPIRWWLADVRQAEVVRVLDYLWVRPLDVEAYLSTRVLGGDEALVVEIHDSFRPQTEGCYRLAPGSAGEPGTCVRTDDEPDLRLGVEALGSLSLGGVSATLLSRSLRVEERRPGALAVADRLFGWAVAPFSTTRF